MMAPVATPPTRFAWSRWALALASVVFVLGLTTVPAFVDEPARTFVRLLFAPTCHQIADRSPVFEGVTLAVCHRCFGVYAGLVLGVAGFLFARRFSRALVRRAGLLILIGVTVPGVDWMLDVLGWWTNTPASRVGTGAVFGIAAGLLLAATLAAPRQSMRSEDGVVEQATIVA